MRHRRLIMFRSGNKTALEPEAKFYRLTFKLRLGVAFMMGLIIILATFVFHHLTVLDRAVLLIILTAVLYLSYRVTISPYIDGMKSQLDTLYKITDESIKASHMLIRRDLDLTRANEKLHELDQAKSNFISIIAHQLRTPLSGIKWTLNMVVSESLGPLNNEQKSFLMKCYESNERLILLINDMLGADRIDSEKIKYHFVPTQIFDLVDNVLFELTSIIKNKDLKVAFTNKDRKLPQVSIDPEKMRAVIQNLLENAVKYTPLNGTIEIGFEEKEGFIQVSINDSGVGIPEKDKKNIFNRFFRASNAVKVQTDGSGLGLFIAKGIIEKHGGKIWFESKVGEGTTFYVTIPISH